MGVDDARHRDPPARELLDDHRVGREVEAHPAVLLGDGHAEQAELLHLLDHGVREGVLVVVLLRDGEDLLVDELAHHVGDRLLLVGLVGVLRLGYGHAAPRLTRESVRADGTCGIAEPAPEAAAPGARLAPLMRRLALDASDLTGVFAPPRWLRDVGISAWLLFGVALFLVGVVWLLSLVQTIAAAGHHRGRDRGGGRSAGGLAGAPSRASVAGLDPRAPRVGRDRRARGLRRAGRDHQSVRGPGEPPRRGQGHDRGLAPGRRGGPQDRRRGEEATPALRPPRR